jgi:uncharacterized membrane protein
VAAFVIHSVRLVLLQRRLEREKETVDKSSTGDGSRAEG